MTERPHTKLMVWQQAMGLVETSYQITQRMPREEQFGLIAQARRAAVSVPANIAEGAARQSRRETLQFYFIARGSLSELETLADVSQRLGFVSGKDHAAWVQQMGQVSALLQGLIRVGARPGKVAAVSQSPNHLIT